MIKTGAPKGYLGFYRVNDRSDFINYGIIPLYGDMEIDYTDLVDIRSESHENINIMGHGANRLERRICKWYQGLYKQDMMIYRNEED